MINIEMRNNIYFKSEAFRNEIVAACQPDKTWMLEWFLFLDAWIQEFWNKSRLHIQVFFQAARISFRKTSNGLSKRFELGFTGLFE